MCRTSLALLLAAIALANVAAAMKIKGMAFGTGHADIKEIRFRHADFSIADLKRTGVNYVHISAYGNMQTLNDLSYRMGTQDKDIRFAIRRMKRAGLKVFFKPVIEISGEQWRGFLDGKDAWFDKVYIPFITSMARIAQQERVDLFAVGSEYVGSLHNTAAWRRTIHKVRAIYRGTLTYVANHDSYFNVKFWDAVDVISLSAYFKFLPGTYGHTLSLKQTKYLWAVQASKLARWRILNGLHKKKILLAEVGFQSKGRGVVYRVPFLWRVKAPQDNWEQAKMYEGLLNAFMPKWWCTGVIFWHWEVKPSAGLKKPYNVGYTPQNKPAVQIMRKYFLLRKY